MKWSIENNTNDILIYESDHKNASYWPKSGMSVLLVNGSIVIRSNGTEVLNAPYPDIVSPSSSDAKDLISKVHGYIGNVGYGSLRGGYADYADSVTSGTPIAVAASAGYVTLTNNGLGVFTNTEHLPTNVSKFYNTSTNAFDFSELNVGDQVFVRVDIDIVVATNNTMISLDLFLGTGGGAYKLNFDNINYKSAGTYKICRCLPIYMGDSNTKDNPAFFKVDTDTDCHVIVNGWFVSAIMKEE